MTSVLIFKSHKNVSLNVYLNNWKSLALPYGLVPNMRVIVSNVVSQKGIYYKSTILTSFQVICYNPDFEFQSAYL